MISCFGFEGWILALIASVPDLRILFTLRNLENIPKWSQNTKTKSLNSKH